MLNVAGIGALVHDFISVSGRQLQKPQRVWPVRAAPVNQADMTADALAHTTEDDAAPVRTCLGHER